ncbi:MAG TPA: adenylosuccinate lyase, partial [Candidatus Dormibacteraeota bacterium]|jgi:adenylosuccinate lyase|nr:adenylosuccinate lyase [Candidatus Dormibacteraeota bacterium]
MALTMGRVLGGLEVRTERMARNLTMGGGVVFSQRVLLALVEFGMSREDAYKIVQSAAHRALDENGNFRSLLELEPAVMALGSGRLDACFDPEAGLEHIDLAFDRLGLATNSGVGA